MKGNANMNKSYEGYSQQESMGGSQAYMTGSPGKSGKPIPPAGILNSKTLAEENLKGFRLRNL
jgi:hypothetical protein